MLDATVALLTYQAGNYFASGKVPARLGNRHPSIVPYETFTASDGEFVLAVGNDEQWRRFCAVAGAADDERFATNRQRVSGYDALRPFVADRLRQRAAPALDRRADQGGRALRIGARPSTSCSPIRSSTRVR